VKTITLLEFRKNAAAILDRIESGEECLLTRRGKPSVRLVPAVAPETDKLTDEDPVNHLGDYVGRAKDAKSTLSNEEIDRLVYGD
jgi:prevent-host-death family protein